MKRENTWGKIRCAFGALHLADKCLLVFMLILMFQSAYSLFFHGVVAQGSDMLDVIVRTTAAAIFGYFISANFQNGEKSTAEDQQKDNDTMRIENVSFDTGNQPKAQIGFSGKSETQKLQTGNGRSSHKNQSTCQNRLQIFVVAGIGVFALFLLLFSRNYFATTEASAATISQLRDFVSGSVGFLIGHSTHQGKS